MPVMPLCHGTLYSRLGSQSGDFRKSIRLASTFGMLAWSSFWIQPSSIIRAAM